MSDFDSMLVQLDKERFKRTQSRWLSSDNLYEFDDTQCSYEEPRLDWTIITKQLNRKKLDEHTLTNRISNVGMRMFRNGYK